MAVLVIIGVVTAVVARFVTKIVSKLILLALLVGAGFFVYSQRDEPAAVDKLLEISKRDPDPELRKKALFWLGQSDDPRPAKALQDIIEQP